MISEEKIDEAFPEEWDHWIKHFTRGFKQFHNVLIE